MAKKRSDKESVAATTVAAKFDDSHAADKALRKVNRTLRDEDKTIYEGAVVTLDRRGDLEIKDMKDVGLGDVIVHATNTTISIDVGGIGLLMGIATQARSSCSTVCVWSRTTWVRSWG